MQLLPGRRLTAHRTRSAALRRAAGGARPASADHRDEPSPPHPAPPPGQWCLADRPLPPVLRLELRIHPVRRELGQARQPHEPRLRLRRLRLLHRRRTPRVRRGPDPRPRHRHPGPAPGPRHPDRPAHAPHHRLPDQLGTVGPATRRGRPTPRRTAPRSGWRAGNGGRERGAGRRRCGLVPVDAGGRAPGPVGPPGDPHPGLRGPGGGGAGRAGLLLRGAGHRRTRGHPGRHTGTRARSAAAADGRGTDPRSADPGGRRTPARHGPRRHRTSRPTGTHTAHTALRRGTPRAAPIVPRPRARGGPARTAADTGVPRRVPGARHLPDHDRPHGRRRTAARRGGGHRRPVGRGPGTPDDRRLRGHPADRRTRSDRCRRHRGRGRDLGPRELRRRPSAGPPPRRTARPRHAVEGPEDGGRIGALVGARPLGGPPGTPSPPTSRPARHRRPCDSTGAANSSPYRTSERVAGRERRS